MPPFTASTYCSRYVGTLQRARKQSFILSHSRKDLLATTPRRHGCLLPHQRSIATTASLRLLPSTMTRRASTHNSLDNEPGGVSLQGFERLSLGNDCTETCPSSSVEDHTKMPPEKKKDKKGSLHDGNPPNTTPNNSSGLTETPQEDLSKKETNAQKRPRRRQRKAKTIAAASADESGGIVIDSPHGPWNHSGGVQQAPLENSIRTNHAPLSTMPVLNPTFPLPHVPIAPFRFPNGPRYPVNPGIVPYPLFQSVHTAPDHSIGYIDSSHRFPAAHYGNIAQPYYWTPHQQLGPLMAPHFPGAYLPGIVVPPPQDAMAPPSTPALMANTPSSVPDLPLQQKATRRKPPQGRAATKLMAESLLKAPQPSKEYVAQASRGPQNLGRPQPLLIVLDLNGTLLYRNGATQFVQRPCVLQFLDYCFLKHRVMVWSSARPENVRMICSNLFKPTQRDAIVAVWGRDTLRLTKQEYSEKVQVYKRLETIWDDTAIQQTHPWVGGRWGQSNTILIDDSMMKASGQPYNHIEVPEFTQSEPIAFEHQTKVLEQVVEYISVAETYGDVSSFIKHNTFELKPVAESNSNGASGGALKSVP